MNDKPTTEGEIQTIYLSPHCSECIGALRSYDEGILWCEDQQEPCEDCGKEWIKYTIAKKDA